MLGKSKTELSITDPPTQHMVVVKQPSFECFSTTLKLSSVKIEKKGYNKTPLEVQKTSLKGN